MDKVELKEDLIPPIQLNITADAARAASLKAVQDADDLYTRQLMDYIEELKPLVEACIQRATANGERVTMFQMPHVGAYKREQDIRKEGLRRLDSALSAQGFSTQIPVHLKSQDMSIKIDWQ